MQRYLFAMSVPVAAVMAGCATGGSQVETTLYDLHRRVVQMERSVDESVNRLNTTTAELNARVDQNDQEVRRLITRSEDHQMQMDRIEADLSTLRNRTYRELGLTTGAPQAEVSVDEVIVESPTGSVTVTPPSQLRTEAPAEQTQVAEAPPPREPTPEPEPTPAPAPAPTGDPQVYYQAAQRSYSGENYNQALQQFDEFLQRYPGSELGANAQFWKAKSHLKLGQYQESIREFQKLINNHPNDTKVPYAIHNQAVAHSNLGQINEAIRLMQRVVDEYPISPAADQARSDLRQLRGN
jgi:tol-pal system protein YbgF